MSVRSSSSDAPVADKVLSTGHEADAALAAMAKVVASYKVQEVALEEAKATMNNLQDAIDLGKTQRDHLRSDVELLEIYCTTHCQGRIKELSHLGDQKDEQIVLLNKTVESLREEIRGIHEENDRFEVLFKSRKKPRVSES